MITTIQKMIEELPIMPVKVTKKQFIEAVENNEEGLTNIELAAKLGISEQYFYDLKKKYRDELRKTAKEMIQKYAVDLARHLIEQSRKGKTEATKTALEMIGLYRSKVDIDFKTRLREVLAKRDQKAQEMIMRIQEEMEQEKNKNDAGIKVITSGC